MARTLIKNGTVISPTGRHRVDVLIEGETISALLEPGKVEALNITADKVIDATGKYVVPGGIDVHTHTWSCHLAAPMQVTHSKPAPMLRRGVA